MQWEEKVLEALNLEDTNLLKNWWNHWNFDWKCSHIQWGTPLIALISSNWLEVQPASDSLWLGQEKVMLARWCIAHGADPEQCAPECCKWRVTLPHLPQFGLRIGGHSAVSLLYALQTVVEKWRHDRDDIEGDDWRDQFARVSLRRVVSMQRVISAARQGQSRIRIPGGASWSWEKVYQSMASADVVFVAKGNSEVSPKEINAHSMVIESVSPVLEAMLRDDSYSEGTHRRIETHWSLGALDCFLFMAYTGCFKMSTSDETPPLDQLLEVAELARGYQVDFLRTPLALRISALVSLETFDAICKFAMLHEEKLILDECLAFVQDQLERCQSSGEWLRSLSPHVRTMITPLVIRHFPAAQQRAKANKMSQQYVDRPSKTPFMMPLPGEEPAGEAEGIGLSYLPECLFGLVASFLDAQSLCQVDSAARAPRTSTHSKTGAWRMLGMREFHGVESGEFGPFDGMDLGWKVRYRLFKIDLPLFRPPINSTEINWVYNDQVAYCKCMLRADLLSDTTAPGVYIEFQVEKNADNLSLGIVDFDAAGGNSLTFSPDTGAVIREKRVQETPRKVEGAFIQPLGAMLSQRFEGSIGVYLFRGHLAFLRKCTRGPMGGWESTGFVTDFSWAEGRCHLTPCIAFRNEGAYHVKVACIGNSPPLPHHIPSSYDEGRWTCLDWEAQEVDAI